MVTMAGRRSSPTHPSARVALAAGPVERPPDAAPDIRIAFGGEGHHRPRAPNAFPGNVPPEADAC